jgi:hypothetical protein
MSRHLIIALSFASLIAPGCGAPDEDVPGQQPQSQKSDAGVSTRSDGMGMKKPNPPILDQIPETVCGATAPIRGTATPGVAVYAMGGLETSGVTKDTNPSTGRFCMNVRLKAGQSNIIEVRVHDPVLGDSDATTVTVKQSACHDDGTPTPTTPKPTNVATGIKGRASQAADQGNEGFLTDGNASTFARYAAGWAWTDADIWVTIKLTKLTEISKIVVKWGATNWGSKYKVLVSAIGDPGDPNLKNGYWTEVKNFDAGAGGTDTIDLTSSKPVAQHVALWLLQDGGSWTWSETFDLAELEVWDSPKATSPTPTTQPNTCESLGD